MTGVATAAALLLAAVLAWAGAVKLAHPPRTAADFRRLRVPGARVAARLVPLAELAVAATLVVRPRLGASGALVLLAAFSGFLLHRRRQGATAGCGCFGAATPTTSPILELGRNVGLGLLATVALAAPLPALPSVPEIVAVTSGAAVIALVLALADVLHRTGRLLDNHLPTGPEAP